MNRISFLMRCKHVSCSKFIAEGIHHLIGTEIHLEVQFSSTQVSCTHTVCVMRSILCLSSTVQRVTRYILFVLSYLIRTCDIVRNTF